MKRNIISSAGKLSLMAIFARTHPEMLVATFWMPPMDMMLCGWQQELLILNLKGVILLILVEVICLISLLVCIAIPSKTSSLEHL